MLCYSILYEVCGIMLCTIIYVYSKPFLVAIEQTDDAPRSFDLGLVGIQPLIERRLNGKWNPNSNQVNPFWARIG